MKVLLYSRNIHESYKAESMSQNIEEMASLWNSEMEAEAINRMNQDILKCLTPQTSISDLELIGTYKLGNLCALQNQMSEVTELVVNEVRPVGREQGLRREASCLCCSRPAIHHLLLYHRCSTSKR